MRRATALALLATLLLATTGATVATAYEGSSLWDNVAPKSEVRTDQDDWSAPW
jgi:hypothetical protein